MFSQGVHFFELIIEFNLEGASNVLTCMARSNIGESKDYIFVPIEYGVTTQSNALPKKRYISKTIVPTKNVYLHYLFFYISSF